jgi:PAT family beta-lactamase induction signal transducer AmpG
MAGCLILGMVVVLLAPEPAGSAEVLTEGRGAGAGTWLKEAVVEPFADFFRRNGVATAALILLFIMFYKLGDALLSSMTNPFYVDLGFSKPEVAAIVKGYGLIATLAGCFLGGLVVERRGVLPALWICGLVQLASNLVFVLQAWVGHDLSVLALTISAENLAGGMGTAAFVAYLSSLCNLSYTATQYALLSSFMAQARTTLAAGSGFLAESTSWTGFFLLTTAAAVPGLLMLFWLQHRLGGMTAAPAALAPARGA